MGTPRASPSPAAGSGLNLIVGTEGRTRNRVNSDHHMSPLAGRLFPLRIFWTREKQLFFFIFYDTPPCNMVVPHRYSSRRDSAVTKSIPATPFAQESQWPPGEASRPHHWGFCHWSQHRDLHGGGENPHAVCVAQTNPAEGLLSRLSPPGPIPLIYLQIKGLFSFPSTATARQTQQSLLSYFPLGPGAGGRWWHLSLRPWKTPSAPQTRLRIHSGLSPKASSPPRAPPNPLPWVLCTKQGCGRSGIGRGAAAVPVLPVPRFPALP